MFQTTGVRMRLKAIVFDVDFRYNEFGQYDTFRASKAFTGKLAQDEAYLFVSKSRNQLLWVMNVGKSEALEGREIIDSRRWRIRGHAQWTPSMLEDYAGEVGIKLLGISRFKEQYAQFITRKAKYEQTRKGTRSIGSKCLKKAA